MADIIAEINAMKRNEIAPGTEYLLHFGKMEAGDAANIVCGKSHSAGQRAGF